MKESRKVQNYEPAENPALDLNIQAIKFRYRWYLKKSILGFKKYKRQHLQLWAFKRFTIAIIKQIEESKACRYFILRKQQKRIFIAWRLAFRKSLIHKAKVSKANDFYKTNKLKKSFRILKNLAKVKKHRKLKNNQLKYHWFMKLVMNVEKLKQKRDRISEFIENRKLKIIKKWFKNWSPACIKVQKDDQKIFLMRKYFLKLKHQLSVKMIQEDKRVQECK